MIRNLWSRRAPSRRLRYLALAGLLAAPAAFAEPGHGEPTHGGHADGGKSTIEMTGEAPGEHPPSAEHGKGHHADYTGDADHDGTPNWREFTMRL